MDVLSFLQDDHLLHDHVKMPVNVDAYLESLFLIDLENRPLQTHKETKKGLAFFLGIGSFLLHVSCPQLLAA